MSRTQCLAVLTMAALISASVVSQDNKAMRTSFVRASQITGTEIQNSDHQKVGTIEDVVFDQDNGTVAFAVVAMDPAMNAGDKLLAVPWASLKATNDAKALALDLPKDRLEKAPRFDRNAWPDINAQWSSEVMAFYGVNRPMQTPRETAQAQPMTPEDGNRNRLPGEDGYRETKDIAPNGHREIMTVNGKVKSFQQRDPAELVILSDRGEIQAELGPVTFLDQQRLTFDPNSDVTVRGYETTRDGRRTFIVTDVITKDGRTVKLRGDDFAPLWAKTTTVERSYPTNGYPSANGATNANPDIRDLSGTVTYVDTATGCGESAQGRLVTVRTDNGERVVALGPGTYLARQHWELRPSDTVAVRGFETTRDGRRVFIATEVRRGNETWRLRREDGSPLW